MPTYKKQHFLPSVYLRRFAVAGAFEDNTAQVWRIDVNARRLVSVRSQGFSDYFYSSDSPEQVEKQFQLAEDFYGALGPERWTNGVPPSSEREFGLLLIMLDLHIRNCAYAKTVTNNFQDYLQTSATVKYRILWGLKEAPPGEQAIVDAAAERWRVRLLRARLGSAFVTSDNPSLLILQEPSASFVNLVLMPLSPSIYAVGYDSRDLEFVSNVATAGDESIFTQLQIHHCSACLYANQTISDEEWAGFKQQFARNLRVSAEGPDLWGTNLFRIPEKSRFDFLKLATDKPEFSLRRSM